MEEKDKKEDEKESKENKGGILSKKDHKKKRKSVNWDIKNLEENELQNKLHPVTMKITEPKTPYTPYEEGDDEYFNKLNEVNKTKPTEDVLAQVINTLEKIPEKKNDEEEYMEIEVIEKDGTKTKKLVKRENKENKEFQAKKKKAYHNEFAIAKEFMLKHKDEDNDEELIKKTMENTLANKYVGLIENQKKEKDKENDK